MGTGDTVPWISDMGVGISVKIVLFYNKHISLDSAKGLRWELITQ